MKIELRNYNEPTYTNLINLLKTYKRVALDQPPSTGKSIISLKYIQDGIENNEINKVLYITSWKVAASETEKKIDKYNLDKDKIDVVTYSTIRSQAFLDSIKDKDYDLIVIDEYQHAGATVTSIWLQKIFEMFKDAKVIGMSATPVRYLDNQKDMSQIIFNGIKASNMSIEEALIKGILPSLQYFTALDNDELIDKIINNYPMLLESNNEEINELLTKLRSYKTNSSKGIRNIITENIKPGEKYVVYFKDLRQLELFKQGILDGTIDWFKDIDSKPNIFELYYKNSEDENEKNYTDFINNNNNHISLLLNINMATEALHFVNKNDDENVINGNIILRDTESPNLFIQMIGRSFTAKNPKIFDFVANIYKDYSIYSFKNELNKVKNGNTNYTNSTDIKVLDQVIEIETILKRLSKILKETDWDKKFNSILNSKLKKYINEDFIRELVKAIENHEYSLEEEIDYEVDYETLEWLKKQINDFNLGILPVYKIEKLKLLGLFSNEQRFNDDDLITINNYFKDINTMRFYKEDFTNDNWHLKLAKFFVMNYYYRNQNQNYELSDYINEIVAKALEYVKNNTNINITILKNQILSHIKEMNQKDNPEIFLEDTNESYTIDNLIDNMEDNKFLMIKLKFLYVNYPKQYEIIKDYFGIDIVNNKIVKTSKTSLRYVAKKKGITTETVRQHLKKGIRKLNFRINPEAFEYLLYQKDYVVELIKETKKLSAHSIISLLNNNIYDEITIKEIRNILNNTQNKIILKHKESIIEQINHIEKEHFNNIEYYKILVIININEKCKDAVKKLFINNEYNVVTANKIISFLARTKNKDILLNKDKIIAYLKILEKEYYAGLYDYQIELIRSLPGKLQEKVKNFIQSDEFDYSIYYTLMRIINTSNNEEIKKNKIKLMEHIESLKDSFENNKKEKNLQ